MSVYILTVNDRREGINSYVFSTKKGARHAMIQEILKLDANYDYVLQEDLDQIKNRFETEDYMLWIEEGKIDDHWSC